MNRTGCVSRSLPWVIVAILGLGVSGFSAGEVAAADLMECQAMLVRGEYAECLKETTAAIEQGVYGESWHLLKADAELATGAYPAALATLTDAIDKYSWSVKLRIRLRDALRHTGAADKVEELEAETARLVEAAPWRYTDAESLVLLGQLALDMGADAKAVQTGFLQRARRNNQSHRLPPLALGQLALSKRDFGLAAETFQESAETFPEDPEILFGLAQAVVESDRQKAVQLMEKVQEVAPRFLPLKLYLIDKQVEGERYDEAEKLIQQVLAVHPTHPQALAYWSVIAFLNQDEKSSNERREKALSTWGKNPEVDYLIGRELSQKYRFREGSERQRQALAFDEGYLPARKQLAEDLLRLGKLDEGWQLVEEVRRADEYDVGAYNLSTLQDELKRFATLERDGLIVRMDAHEAAVYGPRVLDLLSEAKRQLCAKYEVELTQPVYVEIFPNPQDFAVRTFGMPGVVGYLGVCFGNVVTANSPASQSASPANWESVLWHEFAHVVTLNKTHNRMPRWVSEGISVYEERQRNPASGERMTPSYRERILKGRLTPIRQLSSAFLNAGSSEDVAFAYFQSSLVIEHLLDEYGLDALKEILDDLGRGVPVNDAIERHAAPLEELDKSFTQFAKFQATTFGLAVDWTPPEIEPEDGQVEEAIRKWVKTHPMNYPGLRIYTQLLIRGERWDEARPLLERMVALYPDAAGRDSPYFDLAEVYRRLGNVEKERETLRAHVQVDDDAPSAYLRLMELEAGREDWAAVREQAQRLLAVDPLVPHGHRYLADAAEKTGQPLEAVMALEAWLALSPSDPAGVHYRLARLYAEQGKTEAGKRHVLQSLEQAPRFRDAHRLLLELTAPSPAAVAPATPAPAQ